MGNQTSDMAAFSESELAELVTRLAAIERPSASAGERRAADLIAGELRSLGADVTVMDEAVHGTYWRPHGLLSLVAVVAAFARPRAVAALAAAVAAWAAADDLELGRRPLRRALGQRPCRNVVARLGPPDPERVVLVHVHHDAAHTGVVFNPGLARFASRHFGRLLGRLRTTPPMLWTSFAGPALVALGHAGGSRGPRRLGGALAAGNLLAMVDIARAPVVPAANDNLSSVAAALSLAKSVGESPLRRTGLVVFSSGSEESFLEGFDAFGRRGFPGLPAGRTTCLCLESVGSPHLLLLDGEGLLRLHRYPREMLDLVSDCAREAGVALQAPFRFRFATGGQVTLRAGIPTAVVSSIDWYHAPTNYHWPSDRPEALDYGSVAGAAALAEALLRRLDA